VQRGWLTYFRGTNILGKLRDIDGWLRNRLRYCIWHDWKKPERKRKNLIRLGVDQDHAYAWSRTRKGGWAIAQSPILGTTITLKRLKKKGYVSLTELHIQLNPSLCSLSRCISGNRRVRDLPKAFETRWCERLSPLVSSGAVYLISNWCSFIYVCLLFNLIYQGHFVFDFVLDEYYFVCQLFLKDILSSVLSLISNF